VKHGDKNSMGKHIKAMRKISGLTQAQLAHAVGLERTSITNIEAGRQAITDLMVESMARAMGYRVVAKFEKL